MTAAMPALQKITLINDWGARAHPSNKAILHGRIYTTPDHRYLFISASYNGTNVAFRVWQCDRDGHHDKTPDITIAGMDIDTFCDHIGYANHEPVKHATRTATLMHTAEHTDNHGHATTTATYQISPPLEGATTISIDTHHMRNGGSYSQVKYTDTNGKTHTTTSIGWSSDAQKLRELGIIIDGNPIDEHTTPVRDLLNQAMSELGDTDPAWIHLSAGNWSASIDPRAQIPTLTAWTPRYAYTTMCGPDGLCRFVGVQRKPDMPSTDTITRTRAIRDTFIANAPDNMSREQAAKLFDRWLDDQRTGMGATVR